jgi:AraC-like DNA-binding protein
MRSAASLLISAASVKEVSRACGFDDANYFAKAFRSSFGASPTEFRTTGMYAGRARRDGGQISSGGRLRRDPSFQYRRRPAAFAQLIYVTKKFVRVSERCALKTANSVSPPAA